MKTILFSVKIRTMFPTRIIFIFIFLFAIASCKVDNTATTRELRKRQNKLEKTQWKTTASSQLDSDALLDFCSAKDVQEYITLPNGKDIKSREGTYTISKSGYLKITFGKLSINKLEGHVKGNELKIYELFKTKTYHKVKDYFERGY